MSGDVNGVFDRMDADATASKADVDDATTGLADTRIATNAEHRTWHILEYQ